MATERHASSSPPIEGDNLFLDILHEAPIFARRKSTTILWSLIYCFILVGYAVVAVAAPWIFRPVRKLTPSLLCSCDAILLLVTVTAYGTAAMLLVMVWKPYTGFFSNATLLRIIMLVQAVCSGSFIAVYIGYVHRYNSLESQPDVLKSLYSPLQPSSSLEGLRYYDGNRLSDQQMALLQYQRENLHFMSEEILRLQELVSKYERSNDGMTPQVDLAHLLATRDQELRTLTAETNQLHSELKLARSLIAERDTEIQRVNNTNSQYIEENERLRALLGEWSARAAKLERALEMERVSNIEYQKKIASFKNQLRLSPESPDR